MGGDYYYLRLMSRDSTLFDPKIFNLAFDEFLNKSDLKLMGVLDDRDHIITVGNNISGLFSDAVNDIKEFVICDGSIIIHKWPCDLFKMLDNCTHHTNIGIQFPDSYSYEKTKKIFKYAITLFKVFWAELNKTRITNKPSFCSMDGHYLEVPCSGLLNYYGPEYIKVLGSKEKIYNAEFDKVETYYCGVITSLENCKSVEEFNKKRNQVQKNLGDERLFGSSEEPWLHEALWGIKVKIISDEQFNNLCNRSRFLTK